MRFTSLPFFIALTVLFLSSAGVQAAAPAGKMALTTSSDKAMSAFLQGRDLAEKLKAQESIQYFQQAIQQDPKFAVAYLNLAFVEPNAQDFFNDLKKAVSLAGQASEPERLWIMATDAGVKGQPVLQGQYFQKMVAALPNDERAHNLLAVYLFGLQQYDKSVQELQRAVAINPSFSPAYNMLGYGYRFLEKYDDSEKAFRKYIELIPDDPNPYDSYAELLMKIGKYDESVQNYRKALALDPHFVNSYIGIASNLNFKGDHDGARKELDTLYAKARNDGERRTALLGMTISYADEGNLQKAIEQQDKMLALAQTMKDPTSVTGDLNTIGTILLESNKPQEAQAKFDQGLKATAGADVSAEVKKLAELFHLFQTARVALHQKDVKRAHDLAAEFQQKIAAEKNQFQIFLSHQINGSIALAEKNFDQAISELEQSNLQDPYNLYRLGLAYQGKGNAAKGKDLLTRAATFNGLNNLNGALIRAKAKQAAG